MSVPAPLPIAFLLSVVNLAYVWRLRAASRSASAAVPPRHLVGGLLSLVVLLGLVPAVGYQVGWAPAALVLPLAAAAVLGLPSLLPSPDGSLYRQLLEPIEDRRQLSRRPEALSLGGGYSLPLTDETESSMRVLERTPRPPRRAGPAAETASRPRPAGLVADTASRPLPAGSAADTASRPLPAGSAAETASRPRGRPSPYVMPAGKVESFRPPLWAGMERYRLHCRTCGQALTKPVRELGGTMPAFFFDGKPSTSYLRVCQPKPGAFWRSRSEWDTWEGRCVIGGVRFGSDGEVLLLSHSDLDTGALGRTEQLPGSGGCCGYYGGAGPNRHCGGCDALVVIFVEDCEAPAMAAARLSEVELRLEPEMPYDASAAARSPGQQ